MFSEGVLEGVLLLVVGFKDKKGNSEGFPEGVLRRRASRRCLECRV